MGELAEEGRMVRFVILQRSRMEHYDLVLDHKEGAAGAQPVQVGTDTVQ